MQRKKLPKKIILFKILAVFSIIGVYLGILSSVAILGTFAYFSYKVPSPDKLTNRKVTQSTKIYDRNKILLYDVFENVDRTLVTLNDVSPYVIYATLSAEDGDFYKHKGFDPLGILRATIYTSLGSGLQGGSTLTQQLTKNALLSKERTITRKIKELILSMQIENKYDKDVILEWYLNEIPYGSTAYGIEAASQFYFGKSASDLNLAESAFLAGLPQRPTAYSPFGKTPDLGIQRQKYVLKLMKENGWINKEGKREYITQEEYDQAIKYKLQFKGSKTNIKAPHFVFYVLDKLYEKYGEDFIKNSGLEVITTLDLKKQEEVQNIVQEELKKAEYLNVGNAAVMVIDPKTREILVMVGSRDYFDSENGGQFNVATSPTRQPGSSIKPLVYATGLKQGYTASTVFMDVPTTFPPPDSASKPYSPKNYDGKFRGPVQFRYALGNSINIPAVKMLKLVGIPSLLETAQDFGIKSLNPNKFYGLSLALGGGEISLIEMTNAYAVFASKGYYVDPIYIKEIKDNKGNIIEDSKNVQSPIKVLDEGISFIMSDVLSDNFARYLAFGPGNALEFKKHQVAVKTGTTDDIRDNWTIGFTPNIVVGVWAGNNDNSPMNPNLASGITGAAPIWRRSISLFLDDEKVSKFEKPKNVVRVEVGTITGGKPAEGLEDKRWEYFIKGTEPVVRSPMVVELEICKKDGKLANKKCKEDKKTKKKEYIKLTALLPEWQEAVDKWVKENYPKDKDEFKKFYPPTKKSDYGEDDD